jgi:1,4-alpha-glucan branching enzyme
MKKIICLAILLSSFIASAQVVTWTPLFPTANDTIEIVFDATQGNRQLLGSTAVYAHTGVITDLSPNPTYWLYVKTAWGQNTPETRLQSMGSNKWKIRFHIRSYYGVPAGEKILKLAFVFRNADGSKVGKTADNQDIFIPVYQEGLNLVLLSPEQTPFFAQRTQSVSIMATASNATYIQLYIDGSLIKETDQDTLTTDFSSGTPGKHTARIVAGDGSGLQKEIQFDLYIIPDIVIQDLPADVRDGITYLEPTTVLLSLMAPLKSFVYVIGDFNDWQIEPQYFMKRTPDGSHFWIDITGVYPGTEYRFQYLVDGRIRIADPYVEKIVDPWNDQYIEPQTYPGLIAYPQGKTSEIAGVMQTDLPIYSWHDRSWQRPASTDLVIYELLLRDFLDNHDFKTLTDTLGYFKKLGVNALEIMPFNEFEGNDSWGYNPSFYFAPDKYYGPKSEVQRFIDAAHQQGIAVIQDIVLNHAYGQCPLVRLYGDDMAHNPWFNAVSPNPVYAWGSDFNHESPATQAFVNRVLEFWLKEYHMDGFRFDFAKGFTNTSGDGSAYDPARIEILKNYADRIWAIKPGAFVILEHFADNREEKELAQAGMLLWGNMNSNYNEATMGYHENGKSNLSWGSYKARGWTRPGLVTYMESHDEERLMYKNLQFGNSSDDYSIQDLETALDRIKMAATFFFTIPGPKMLWQFGELGYDYSIDYDGRLGRKPIRWDYLDDDDRLELFEVFSKLIRLKIEQPAFESSQFSMNVGNSMKSIHLNHETMNVTVIGNFDVVSNSINPQFQSSGWWYDFLESDSLYVADPQSSVTMDPGEFHVYTSKRVEAIADVKESSPAEPTSFVLSQNYPNPFNQSTFFTFSIPRAGLFSARIYNIQGQLIRTLLDNHVNEGENGARWDGCDDRSRQVTSGLYLCRIEYGGQEKVLKMLLIR